jgi:hypothetical protein
VITGLVTGLSPCRPYLLALPWDLFEMAVKIMTNTVHGYGVTMMMKPVSGGPFRRLPTCSSTGHDQVPRFRSTTVLQHAEAR